MKVKREENGGFLEFGVKEKETEMELGFFCEMEKGRRGLTGLSDGRGQ